MLRRIPAILVLLTCGLNCFRAFPSEQTDALTALMLSFYPSVPCGSSGPAKVLSAGTTYQYNYAFGSPGILEAAFNTPSMGGCTPARYSATGNRTASGAFNYGFGGFLQTFTYNGVSGSVSYSSSMRPIVVVSPCNNTSAGTTLSYLNYDSRDRLTSTYSTTPQFCLTASLPATVFLSSSTVAYTGVSNLVSSSTSSTGSTSTFTNVANAASQITQITSTSTSPATTHVEDFTYVNGLVTSTVCTTTSGSNSCNAGAATSTTNFGYDSSGRLASITASGLSITFTYDGLGRIISWTGPFGGSSTTYAFSY